MAEDLPTLDLRCFGPPDVRVRGGEPPPDVLWRKNLALLVYLALSPNHTRSREHLLGLLWPEKDESKARHSLNEAIRRLRAGLGADRILSKGDVVTLNRNALSVDALEDAGTRLASEFLEGLSLNDAPAFEDWLMAERAGRRDRALAALLTEAERAIAGLKYGAAQDAARQMLSFDPYSEPAVRLLMRAETLGGDAAGALRVYHEFSQRLESELGERASRELRDLAERIRTGRWRRQSAAQVEAEPPLVGRTTVHQEAFGLIAEGLSRGTRVLVVTGETGAGKSRLLAECANRWALEGGTSALARPLEGDRDVAWSALRQLLRGGLADAPGLAGTDPGALGVLASLDPELGRRFEPRAVLDHAQVATALAALLKAVADEQPLALLVDDAQFADPSTLETLTAAASAVRALPLVVALAAPHDQGNANPELTHLQGEIGRRLTGAVLHLDNLNAADLRELVDALANWCDDNAQRDRLARRLMFETGGNPFLCVTLLSGLLRVTSLREDATQWPPPRETLQAPVPIDVPNLVRLVTVARVHTLSDTARKVLVAASVADRTTDVRVLAALSELATDRVEKGLEDLERAGFITFDGERYTLEAPIIARVIQTEFLTPGQRKRLIAKSRELGSTWERAE